MTVVSTELHSQDGIDPTKADPESLLKTPSEPPPPEEHVLFLWLYVFSWVLVTFICGMAVYGAGADAQIVSFIVAGYAIALLLFYYAQRCKGLPFRLDGRTELLMEFKSAVWFLSLVMNCVISILVSLRLPPPLPDVVLTARLSTSGNCVYIF